MQEQTLILSHSGPNQVLTIPHSFELPSDEVVIRKEGNRLIVEPVRRPSLLAFLSTLSPLDEDFSDFDEDLLPLDDIDI